MREDIQCLRGIAILFVLLFHFAPNIFVNGFLGVDIFFVISGFLMAKNLTASDNLTKIHDYLMFYYMRFRRILTLYYFAVLLITIMVHTFLADVLWKNNDRYSLASLFMVTNQLVIHDQADYFNQQNITSNFFAHTWAQSTEVQFHLMAPFIVLPMKRKSSKVALLSVLAVCSFFYAVSIDVESNHILTRSWQFIFGMIAQLKVSDHILSLKRQKKFAVLSLFALISYSTPINSCVARFENFNFYNVHLNKTFTSLDQVEVQNRVWQMEKPVASKNESWMSITRRKVSDKGFKFMILGSSTIANLALLIHDECEFKAKEFVQLFSPECEPFYPSEHSNCSKTLNEFHKAVKAETPDYLFIGGRWLDMGNPMSDNNTNLEYDKILAVAKDQMENYMENVIEKIVVVHAFPRPNVARLGKITKYIREKLTADEIDKNIVETLENGYIVARRRYDVMIEKCGDKCEVIDYTSIFNNSKTKFVRYFDDIGFNFFNPDFNLTPLGLEVVRSTVKNICLEI